MFTENSSLAPPLSRASFNTLGENELNDHATANFSSLNKTKRERVCIVHKLAVARAAQIAAKPRCLGASRETRVGRPPQSPPFSEVQKHRRERSGGTAMQQLLSVVGQGPSLPG